MITILFTIFFLLTIFYCMFLLKIIKGLGKLTKPAKGIIPEEFVSVIIPFRNESDNILKNLSSIQKQNYPVEKFEVIYVDDSSTDGSFEILQSIGKNTNIKVLKLPGENPVKGNKKRAVQFGIENSNGEIIVATDADCTHKNGWLKSILNYFDTETAFISGPVSFKKNNNFFSKVQQIEFSALITAGAGLIGNGTPTICNGANIAYRKNAYNEVGGFADNIHLSSGDDEFLMQKISRETKYKIQFCLDREAIVETESNKTISDFFEQRKRWASKGLQYQDKKLVLNLILIFLFYLGIVLELLLILWGYLIFIYSIVCGLLIKIFLEYLIVKKGEDLLFDKNRKLIFLTAELFQIPYIVLVSIAGIFGSFKWKNRKIKS
jgi:poly-beta-1,6-N-acetyl-D-glucosamine synthase